MSRRLLAVSFILVVTAAAIASQTLPAPTVIVTIRQSNSAQEWDAAVGLQQSAFYLGGPGATVIAQTSIPGSAPKASSFSIRAWKEGDKARTVVYAVLTDSRAPKGQTETPIATFTLTVGQSIEVTETEQWGGAHVIVSAIPKPSTP